MADRIHADMSLTEVRLLLNTVHHQMMYLQFKDSNNPMKDKDYDLLKISISAIEKMCCSRWTKEFY